MISIIDQIKNDPNVSGTFKESAFPNPNKTRDDMLSELEDWYSALIYGMSDEDLREEYRKYSI